MSEKNTETSSNDQIAHLKERLVNLRQIISKEGTKTQKKRKTYVIMGAVLTVVSFLSLASLTNMAFKLDAHALTQIGRLEVEKHLPGGREDLTNYLSAEAPTVVRHTVESLLDLIPQLRSLLVRDLDKKLDVLTQEGETQLAEHMNTATKASKAQIDKEFPDLTDEERLTQLVSVVAADFTKNVEIVFDAIYPDFVSEMDRVQTFLDDLSSYDDSQLTQRERTQKELIQTLLKLMILEQSGQTK